MDSSDIISAVEAILFAAGEPVSCRRMASVLGVEEDDVDNAVRQLSDRLSFERRGIRVVQLEDSYQMCSAGEYAGIIRLALETRKPPQLSPSALEVLAVTAYFQPVTKAYIEQVRGVDCSYTLKQLLTRGLIEEAGHLEVPGRPYLYKTTKAFLRTFGLTSLADLPELPEKEPDKESQDKLQNAINALMPNEKAENTTGEEQ